MRGQRLEFSVGIFLLLSFASLVVLAIASTNQRFGLGQHYALTARFTQIGQLREQAPVRIGGVTIGQVARIRLDPKTFESVVSLSVQQSYNSLPADTSAAILTSGLLGESYIALQPGGDPGFLKPGDEIAYTQPAVDLIQLVGKYMFSGGADKSKQTERDQNTMQPSLSSPATKNP